MSSGDHRHAFFSVIFTLCLLSFFFLHRESAVGMWESRVLGEIPKSLWKPLCGFHRDDISTGVFAVARDRAEWTPLAACRSSVPSLKRRPSVKRPVFVLVSPSFAFVFPPEKLDVSHVRRASPAAEQAPRPSAGPAQVAVDGTSWQNDPQRSRNDLVLRQFFFMLPFPYTFTTS